MVAMRSTSTQQKWVHKLVAEPRSFAALENINGKTLDIQKQLIEIIYQVKLLTDKSTNLLDALIGNKNLNKMQGTMDEHLAKLLAEQKCRSVMCQLEIQLANTRVEVMTQHRCTTDLEEAFQTSKHKPLGIYLLGFLALKAAIPAIGGCPQQTLLLHKVPHTPVPLLAKEGTPHSPKTANP